MSILKKVHDFAKGRRLISGGLSHLGYSKAAGIAKQLGYGRRRRTVRRRQRGSGIKDTLQKLHGFVKKRRVVSGGLKHFGFNTASKIAHQLGYGRKRKRTVRRRQRGGSIWSSIGNFFKKTKLISGAAGLIPGVGGIASRAIAGQLGVGRRRPRQRGGCYGYPSRTMDRFANVPRMQSGSGGRYGAVVY